MKIIPKCTYLC